MERTYWLQQGFNLQELYSRKRIEAEVARLAEEISDAYAGEQLLVVVVLNGAVFFAADLVRALRFRTAIAGQAAGGGAGPESGGSGCGP